MRARLHFGNGASMLAIRALLFAAALRDSSYAHSRWRTHAPAAAPLAGFQHRQPCTLRRIKHSQLALNSTARSGRATTTCQPRSVAAGLSVLAEFAQVDDDLKVEKQNDMDAAKAKENEGKRARLRGGLKSLFGPQISQIAAD